MLKTKKIIALLMAIVLTVSMIPAVGIHAVDISPTFAVTYDKDGMKKDGTTVTDGFELWTKTTSGTVRGEMTDVTVSSGIVKMPTSFKRNGTPGAAGSETAGLGSTDEINFLTLSDTVRGNRIVESFELTVNAGYGGLVRPYGIIVGLYEENGYMVGVGFNGVGQMFPSVDTSSHSMYLDNNAGNVFGNNAAFFDGTETTYNNNDRINSSINVTYKFEYVYTDSSVTSIKWTVSAARADGSDTPFYYGANTGTKTQYTGPLAGTFQVASNIMNNTKWLNHTNFTSVATYNKQATLTWNASNCVPVVISGNNDAASSFLSVKYNVKKTDQELEAEAAQAVPQAVNAAYTAFSGNKTLESAETFLAAYAQLTDNLLAPHATQIADVKAWLTGQHVQKGEFTYTAANLEDYPATKEYISANGFGNLFDGSLVQSATAVFDKTKLAASSTEKELIFLNGTTAAKNGQGNDVSISGFSISVSALSDGANTALIPFNSIGDAKTVNSTADWEIGKSASGYGKLDWNDQFKVYNEGTSGARHYDFEGAGKMDNVNAYATTSYIAISYTVNYADDEANKYTKCMFRFTLWADDGDGVLETGETVLFEEDRMDPNAASGTLLYNYKDGAPRRFAFGGIGEAGQSSLVSLKLRNDFVADYSATYETAPKADTVPIENVLNMKADLDTVYPSFITTDIRAKAEAAYVSILPAGNSATVRADANQNLAFYGVRPAFFDGCTDTQCQTYLDNLEKTTSFGAVFQSYDTMVSNGKLLTVDQGNNAGNIAKQFNDETGYEITDSKELMFTLSNIDLRNTDTWGYWIVARFYVKYQIGDEIVTVYSMGTSNKPAEATGLTEEQASGTTVRSVNGIMMTIFNAIKANQQVYKDSSGVQNNGGESYNLYAGKSLTDGLGLLQEKTAGASNDEVQMHLCYFLISYRSVIKAIAGQQ